MIKNLLFTLLLFYSLLGRAQTITTNSSGNWNTGSTWSGGTVPAAGDSVVIQNTHLVTLDMPGSGNNLCKSLNILNGGVLEYRATGIAILAVSNSLTIASGGTFRTITGSTQLGHSVEVAGNIANSGTFNIQLNKLTLGGNFSGSGTTFADSITATIETNGSSSQTINTTFNNAKIANVVFNNSASFTNSVTFTNSAQFLSGSVSGTITLGNGSTTNFTYLRGNGTHGSVTKNYGSGTTNFTYTNTSNASTGTELPSIITKGTLLINSASGITLSAACSTQYLTMTAGILFTTSSNLLTVIDTGRYAVTRTSGWVNGPMRRLFPPGINTIDATRVYLFPVGKASYAGLEMVTPMTRNTATGGCPTLVPCLVQVEAFDGATGGGASAFTALKTNRYWFYSVPVNPCMFYSSGIRVYDSTTTDTISMGVASSKTGTYNNIGGFYNANTIGGTQPIYPTLIYGNSVYINLGGKPTLAGGTYTVGASGRDYTGITGVSNALHSKIVTGNLIFEFYDNYSSSSEIIPFTFWPFAKRNGDWTVTLRPHSSNTTDLLSQGDPADPDVHAFNFPLLTFEGARNITIDGRKGGSGTTPAWIFRNTATLSIGPVVRFQNDACSDTIKYLNLEGQNNSNSGLVDIHSTSYTTGNDSNGVIGNMIRKRTDTPAAYNFGISSNTTTTGPKNDYNTFDGNSIENTKTNAIVVGSSAAGDGWTIKNNHIYCSDVMTNSQLPINFIPGSSSKYNKINNNYIGGSAANAAGTWENSFQGALTAIYVSADTVNKQEIIGNTIRNFKLSNTTLSYFYGIWANLGNYAINNNTIGDALNDSSILAPYGLNFYGIQTDSFTNVSIGNNYIGGYLSHKNNAGSTITLYGMKINSQYAPNIYNNTIQKLTIKPYTSINALQTNYGIFLSNSRPMSGINIRKNLISNLTINDGGTANSINRAIYVRPHNTSLGNITRNKIFGGSNNCTGTASENTGIYLDEGNFSVNNNQVVITNESFSNDMPVYGIYDVSSNASVNNYYYNSVRIGGSQSSGTASSYGFRRTVTATVNIKNNLLYNSRTGGTGAHLAIANSNAGGATGWGTTASMHNLYAVTDTSKVGIWISTVYGNGVFRTKSAGDTTSWIYLTSDLPHDSLFVNPASDLTINTNRSFCYAVNGKGTQLSNISEDYTDSLASRSVLVAEGAPDIGADEITPNSNVFPVQLTVTGSHTNGGTEIFQQGGRRVFELTWGSSGTLPTLERYVYYTGIWPNDTTNGGHGSGKRYLNSYIRIDTTASSAGAGYNYTMKYYYDQALLGKIQTESNMIFVKKKTNVGATWDSVITKTHNTFQNSISSSSPRKFTSFSEFTLSENNNTVLPIIISNYSLNDHLLTFSSVNDLIPSSYQITKTERGENSVIAKIKANNKNLYADYSFLIDDADQSGCYIIAALDGEKIIDQTPAICMQRQPTENEETILIYPNPASEYVNVTFIASSEYTQTIKLIDMSGRLLYERNISQLQGSGNFYIPLDIYSNGVYNLHVDVNGKSINKRLTLLR